MTVAAPSPSPGPGPGPGPRPGGFKGGSTPRLGNGPANVTPSPARESRTTINWIGAELPRADGAGYGQRSLPLSALFTPDHRPEAVRLGRPTIVYFYTVKDDEALLDYEAKVFGDERVGVSSRFFNCVRISLDEMRSQADRQEHAGNGPSIHLLDGEGRQLRRYDGTALTSTKLYETMKAVVKAHYKKDLHPFLLAEGRILDVLDRTWWDTKLLEEDLKATEAHLKEHNCAHGRKQVQEIRGDIAKLKEEREKALKEEEKILKTLEEAPGS